MTAGKKETRGYYTVVYRVDGNDDAHNAWWATIQPLFLSDKDDAVSVTAISKADEITRMNCVEKVAESGGTDGNAMIEEVREILVHPDPHIWWIEHDDDSDQRSTP
jgi:hypothetical protein